MSVNLDNLKLLIEAEKKYLDRLDIIDSVKKFLITYTVNALGTKRLNNSKYHQSG